MTSHNQKLTVGESLLASVVHFAEESVIITDTDLVYPGPRILYVNPAFTRMTGYQPEEVLGESPRILHGPKTDRMVIRTLKETIKRGDVFHGLAINNRKDGSEFWNEWHIEPIRDAKGLTTHYLAILHDVTARVEARQAMEQKNAALREILEHIQFEKKKIRDDVVRNLEQIILPSVQKLKRKGSRLDQQYLTVLEQSLEGLISTLGAGISDRKIKLSPREIEIANLIKNGKTSKEICEMLNVSAKTVETHRNRIRRKLGVVNKDVNLASLLKDI